MTDPGASAGSQQPGVTEPARPDAARDPQTEGAANPPHDPTVASSQPISKKVPACGSAPGIEDSASRFEIVPAFQTWQIYSLAPYLAGIADNIAQAKAALLASVLPKVRLVAG